MNTLIACATCANNFADNGPNAAGWAIMFMLGVILAMLGGIAFFMIRIARRQSAELDPELRDEPVPSTASSH